MQRTALALCARTRLLARGVLLHLRRYASLFVLYVLLYTRVIRTSLYYLFAYTYVVAAYALD